MATNEKRLPSPEMIEEERYCSYCWTGGSGRKATGAWQQHTLTPRETPGGWTARCHGCNRTTTVLGSSEKRGAQE